MTTAVASKPDRTVETFAGNAKGKRFYEIPDELEILAGECRLFGVEANKVMLAREIAGLDTDQIAQIAADKIVNMAGMFRIMTPKDGDKRVVWWRRSLEQIKAARLMFLDLIAQGMTPYRVGVDGKATAEVMTEFDSLAEEVIFMPVRAISGG